MRCIVEPGRQLAGQFAARKDEMRAAAFLEVQRHGSMRCRDNLSIALNAASQIVNLQVWRAQ